MFVNWFAQPELLFDVQPGCFIPQPKVTSSVIRLTRRSEPPAEVKSEAMFMRVVKAAFAQRRKTLLNALSAGFGEMSKETVEKNALQIVVLTQKCAEKYFQLVNLQKSRMLLRCFRLIFVSKMH